MPRLGSLRSGVNARLKALARDGVITSFQTNFNSLNGLPSHIMVTANVVTIASKPGYDAARVAQIRDAVRRKLNPLCPGVMVSVRDGLGTVAAAGDAPSGITGKQCQAARRLLGWKVEHTSHVTGVSPSVIRTFEQGRRKPQPATFAAIAGALTAAGIEFTSEEPGVRLRQQQ